MDMSEAGQQTMVSREAKGAGMRSNSMPPTSKTASILSCILSFIDLRPPWVGLGPLWDGFYRTAY